jgi:hypothetical protein
MRMSFYRTFAIPRSLGKRSELILGSDQRVLRLLASRSVADEVTEHLDRMAAPSISLAALKREWQQQYGPRLWVVEIPANLSDPEVQSVILKDPDDATSISLARMVAPCLLFSGNTKHLPLAVPDWLAVTRQVKRLARAQTTLEGASSMMGITVTLPIYGLVGLGGAVRRLPWVWSAAVGAGLLVSGLLYFRSQASRRHRERLVRYLIALATKIGAELDGAWQVRAETAPLVEPRCVRQPDELTPTNRAARLLAMSPWRTATEVAECLQSDVRGRWTATRVKAEILEPFTAFVARDRRWALGETLAIFTEA